MRTSLPALQRFPFAILRLYISMLAITKEIEVENESENDLILRVNIQILGVIQLLILGNKNLEYG